MRDFDKMKEEFQEIIDDVNKDFDFSDIREVLSDVSKSHREYLEKNGRELEFTVEDVVFSAILMILNQSDKLKERLNILNANHKSLCNALDLTPEYKNTKIRVNSTDDGESDSDTKNKPIIH